MNREDIEKIAEEWLEKWVEKYKWDTPDNAKKSLATLMERAGIERAAKVCDIRAKAERDYNFAGKGEWYAAPYERLAEDIRALLR